MTHQQNSTTNHPVHPQAGNARALILPILEDIRHDGAESWMARCPAHDDSNPSLSIRQEPDKVLLQCFAGCATEDVVAALDLDMRDLFASSDRPIPSKPEKSPTQKYAREIWERADLSDEAVAAHPYARRKGITASCEAGRAIVTGSKVGQDADCLIVPIRSIYGDEVIGIECINAAGKKQGFGQRREGCLILSRNTNERERWFMVEGWADGVETHRQTGDTVVVAFGINSFNTKAVMIAGVYAPKRVHCLIDAGMELNKPILPLRALGDTKIFGHPLPPGPNREKDPSDYGRAGLWNEIEERVTRAEEEAAKPKIIADIGHRLTDFAEQPQPDKPHFEYVWLDDIEYELDQPTIVHGLIKPESLIVTFGSSGVGKSFHTQDRDMCNSVGVPWYYDRETEPGLIVYVAAEGPHGTRQRARLYREHWLKDHDKIPFVIVPKRLNLRDAEKPDTENLIDDIKRMEDERGVKCIKVTADTLSSVLHGSSNEERDLGALMNNADRIRHAFGCAFEFDHHEGKDASRGAMGHTSLKAAVDTEIRVTREGNLRTATVTKQRDLPEGDQFHFTIESVEIGTDRYGKPVTVGLVNWQGNARQRTSNLTKTQKRFMRLLDEAMALKGRSPPYFGGKTKRPPKPGQIACPEDSLRTYILSAGGLSESDKPDSESKSYRRVRQQLQERRIIEVFENWIWWSDTPDKAGQF